MSKEQQDRLNIIAEMTLEALQQPEQITVPVFIALNQIYEVATGVETFSGIQLPNPEPLRHAIISCATCLKSDHQTTIGFIVEYKNDSITLGQPILTTLEEQAEYDAIYLSLTTFFNMHNNPQCEVEVRSDSMKIIQQLKGEMECSNKKLENKRNLILELVSQLPVPIKFVWRPKNSTKAMTRAYQEAQRISNQRK